MGTSVVSGTGLAVAVATGGGTLFGSMASKLVEQRPPTAFDIGVNKVSWLLIRFMLVMVPVVFLINGIVKHEWLDAFFFSVAIAVGLTPEMLPMIVNANLARGARVMAKEKTIVKRLNAIQNFGAMDVLCTDKTGTLTQDRVVLTRHLDIHGVETLRVLLHASLNSLYQTGLKNLIDHAIIAKADEEGVLPEARHFVKIDEVPFDFQRRRMSVILRAADGTELLVCKGAMEEMLEVCSQVEDNGATVPMTDALRDQFKAMRDDLNSDGLRTLAVAHKPITPADYPFDIADEDELILTGFVAFLDPPKETVSEALRLLREHGVEVKILTGDNAIVCQKVCRDVGLTVKAIVDGRALDGLDDAALSEAAEHATIFAKLSPIQKARIVQALKKRGHTVGFMGDGINDASALREADVGISVDTAVDVAKEAADIILLEKSLLVLEKGVIEGRRTFGNIIKYIKMTASSNFGNVFSVLIASAFIPFLPMLAIQLLVQNLLYDFSQISIPWDRMDEDFVKQPHQWDAGTISRFMLWIGPISSIFDITTFFVMWHVFGANTLAHEGLFQSGWFVVGLLTQTLIVHMIRTEKVPFFESTAAPVVLVCTGIVMLIGIWLPFSFLAPALKMEPLPGGYFIFLPILLLAYCLLTQVVKKIYIRRFGNWL
jgi:Mg2+-importing ATPase